MDSDVDLVKKIIESTNKVLGEGSVMSFGQETLADVTKWVPTGSKVLDAVVGKGIPMGRIIEIYGLEATGKSTLGMQILASTQKMGGIAAMIDTETSYDAERAKVLGIDTNTLLYAQLDSIEECFRFIQETSTVLKNEKTPRQFTVLWDSLAATPAGAELEAEFGQKQYSPGALVISQGFRKLKREMTWKNVTLVIINQVRTNVGGYGYNTYGGLAPAFYASVRLSMAVKRQIPDPKVPNGVSGVEVEVVATKNKVFCPFRKCILVLDFKRGIDDVATTCKYAVEQGVIENNSGWCTCPIPGFETKSWRYNALEAYFREHPDVLDQLLWVKKPEEQKIDESLVH